MTPYPTKFCAFVGHQNIPQWLKLGWMVIADLGPTHGEYSVLMAWICKCACVKPTREEFDSTPALPVRGASLSTQGGKSHV